MGFVSFRALRGGGGGLLDGEQNRMERSLYVKRCLPQAGFGVLPLGAETCV